VDLAFPLLRDAERAELKETLQAAAIPHWCDEGILSALLEISTEASNTRLAQLRRLSVVEAFPARGDSAVNVHEAARRELREWMLRERPNQFSELTKRAVLYFADQAGTPARIEAAFHQTIDEPQSGADSIESLYSEWARAGRVEDLQALAVVLVELRLHPYGR
jgi:hypothetical protein